MGFFLHSQRIHWIDSDAMQFTLYHEWELVAKNWGTTLLLHKSFNSLSCIFCPSRFLQKRLLRRSWLESGHGWLAPRVAIGCHRFLVQPARFQRVRSSAFSPGLFDNYCPRDFNELDRSAFPLWKYFQFKADFDPEVNESHFFNFETRMRIFPIQSRTSRRDENFWSHGRKRWFLKQLNTKYIKIVTV